MLDKTELRRILKERRAGISPEKHKAWDAAIVERISLSDSFRHASALLLYAPMEGEINLLPLARLARQRGIPIAFPRCHKERGTMEFCILSEDARLSPGAYGIPEPPEDAPICTPDEHTLCLLPGLSFDAVGNRLGYGKGYYDRYLKNFPGVTLGAVYTYMMLKTVPTDAHDIPVQMVVNEYELSIPEPIPEPEARDVPQDLDIPPFAPLVSAASCAPTASDTAAEEVAVSAKKNGRRMAFVSSVHAFWRRKNTDGIKALHLPPILVLLTFVLLLLSHLIDTQLLSRDNEYIGVILLQVLIFILPAILYTKARGERFTARIRLTPVKLQHLFLLLWMLLMMVSLGLLTSILTGGIHSLKGNFTLYNTFVAHTGSPWDIVYSILAYAVLPAFGEELVFRSILCAEYEGRGVAVSVTVSALFFAMLHFSFPLFLTYLTLGGLLALSMYATRSFLAPVLLHLCYNLFCLFGRPYLSAFYIHAGSHEIFLFCLIVLLLLSSALAAGEARKIYHIYATKNADASYTSPLSPRRYPKTLFFSLATPATAACLILFAITAAVNLF